MRIITTANGFALVFKDADDLRAHSENLTGMYESLLDEELKNILGEPPFIYACFSHGERDDEVTQLFKQNKIFLI